MLRNTVFTLLMILSLLSLPGCTCCSASCARVCIEPFTVEVQVPVLTLRKGVCVPVPPVEPRGHHRHQQ